MSLKTFVKVGHVSNLSDARYCAGMEVNLLGFSFDGPEAVSLETFEEISGWLSGVDYVAEFDSMETNDILEIIGNDNIQYVQITRPELIEPLSRIRPVILKWDVNDLQAVPRHLDIAYLLIDGTENMTLDNTIKSMINDLGGSYKVLLGAGIIPENLEEILDELTIHGIAMKGSDEIRPGYKDYDQLADILEMLETE